MASDALIRFCKYALFGTNFLIWVLGCVIFGVGMWARIDREEYFYYSGLSYLSAAPALLITCGIILFFLGIIGCVAITREISSILVVYSIVLILLIILELAGAIYGVDQRQWIYDTLVTSLTDVINRFEYDKGDWRLREMLDELHRDLYCCGVHGPHDFPSGVPESCKVLWHVNPYEYGCGERLFWIIWLRGGVIAGVGFAIAGVQLFGAIIALVLSSEFKNMQLGV